MSEFASAIACVLERKTQTGFCQQTVMAYGIHVRHTFAWTVGMGCYQRMGHYARRFGPLPEWVTLEHPSHRMQLCRLAMERNRPLPVHLPLGRREFWYAQAAYWRARGLGTIGSLHGEAVSLVLVDGD
ncbi:MAG: hypothetical protein QM719_10230 [Thermomonas sp.]